MASIDLQVQARAKGKKLSRVKAKVRASAMSDTGIIIDVTAPDGTVVTIDVDTHRDHKGVCIAPRADLNGNPFGDASVYVGDHSAMCRIMTDRALEVRCDCDASRVAVIRSWVPAREALEWMRRPLSQNLVEEISSVHQSKGKSGPMGEGKL